MNKADKEMEIIAWMTKNGYDRKASQQIAPIIAAYLEENISSNLPVSEPLPPKVKFRLQQIALADDEMIKNKCAAEIYRNMVREILDELYGNVR